jgi:hypothetical protein
METTIDAPFHIPVATEEKSVFAPISSLQQSEAEEVLSQVLAKAGINEDLTYFKRALTRIGIQDIQRIPKEQLAEHVHAINTMFRAHSVEPYDD